MLRIFTRQERRWVEIPNGPFPITEPQLDEARRRFQGELEMTIDPLGGVHMAPQTTARDILHEVAPALSDFDAMMVGFAVSCEAIKTEPVDVN